MIDDDKSKKQTLHFVCFSRLPSMRKISTLTRFARCTPFGTQKPQQQRVQRCLRCTRPWLCRDFTSRNDVDTAAAAPVDKATLSVLPAMEIEDTTSSEEIMESFGKISFSSSAEVWKKLTRRLLATKGELSPQEYYLLEECIRWWARRRIKFDVVDPNSGRFVWNLWKRILQDGSGSSCSNISTELLNLVLDHWRLCVKQNVHVPVRPSEVVSDVRSLSLDVSDVRSFSIIMAAMAYSKDVDPKQAEELLFQLPRHVSPNTVLWNAALTVWAKIDSSNWPDAYLRADELFQKLLRHPSVKPDAVSYVCLMEAYANTSEDDAPTRVQTLFDDMQSRGYNSPIAYLQLMRAWTNSKSLEGADHAARVLDGMVQAYLKNPDCVEKPVKQCFSVVMEGYAKRGEPDRVEQLFLQLQDLFQKSENDDDFLPTASAFNSVLSAYTRCRLPDRAERAEQLLMSMRDMSDYNKNARCMPDAISINTVINAWAESNGCQSAVERAEDLLHAMQHWPGIEPDHYSYTSVMKTWARSDRPNAPDMCEAYLRTMWRAFDANHVRIRPSEATYATAIYAWSRSKTREAPIHAEKLYREMVERYKSGDGNLKPKEATYMTLMTTWNRSNLPEARSRVEYYFKRVRESYIAGDDSVRPSARVYNAFLTQLKKVGDGVAAENVLELMEQDFRGGNRAAQPNTLTFNTALSAWANSRVRERPERAEKLLTRMSRLHRDQGWDCEPSAVSYSCILDCWAKSNRLEAPLRAESILRHMKELSENGNQKLKPTSHAWATVINAWSRSSDPEAPERAQLLLDEMQDMYDSGDITMRPSGPAYSSLITCWAKCNREDGPHRALSILRSMAERHARNQRSEPPGRFHYSAAINAFASKGDFSSSKSLLCEMIYSKEVEPHYGCFNATLKAIARSRSSDGPSQAEEIFAKMKELARSGVECAPTVVTYTTLLDILGQNPGGEAVTKADRLLREMMDLASKRGGQTPVPNAGTFLNYFKILSNSSIPDKEAKVNVTMEFMKSFDIKVTSAILREVERCAAREDKL